MYLLSLLEGHGVLSYADVTDWYDPAQTSRLLICMDSLWKNKTPPRYDFVWVDEIHEVIGSLVSLKVKAPGSGRWAVFDALKAMLSTSPRVLLTSASADEAVRDMCVSCGLEAYWQMNGEPLLMHIKYELSHYDSSEVAFRQINDALEAGKKIVLPCAEQKDLESILEHIKQNSRTRRLCESMVLCRGALVSRRWHGRARLSMTFSAI